MLNIDRDVAAIVAQQRLCIRDVWLETKVTTLDLVRAKRVGIAATLAAVQAKDLRLRCDQKTIHREDGIHHLGRLR